MDGKISSYQKTDTLGKSQLELVLKVYDGAIGAYRSARESYEQKDASAGYEKLERAKKFIVHLYTTLDPEAGGQMADNLGRLYTFVVTQTDLIAATKDLAQMDNIIEILSNLRAGWAGIKQQQTKNEATAAPTGRPASPDGHFSTSG
ncbi:MAG: flagellar protein FliS [candidate division Zixibacteria bacterium]|nr:flagellar protein FliS [candidate division Zixibacteria bacterium]